MLRLLKPAPQAATVHYRVQIPQIPAIQVNQLLFPQWRGGQPRWVDFKPGFPVPVRGGWEANSSSRADL